MYTFNHTYVWLAIVNEQSFLITTHNLNILLIFTIESWQIYAKRKLTCLIGGPDATDIHAMITSY